MQELEKTSDFNDMILIGSSLSEVQIRVCCSWSRTIGLKLLYGFVIVRVDRRDLVWIDVTTNPTAEWIARRITKAFPWDGAPRYPRSNLRHCRHAPVASHWHSGQADCTGLALEEWLCRTADKIDPARVFGPHHCLR
jgi:hypothetical protein